MPKETEFIFHKANFALFSMTANLLEKRCKSHERIFTSFTLYLIAYKRMKLPELWEFSKLNSHDVGDNSLLQIPVKSIFEETLWNQLHKFLGIPIFINHTFAITPQTSLFLYFFKFIF